MKRNLDLHVHSQASPDGRMTLEKILETAKTKGLSAVAICDHDAVLSELPQDPDVLVIPGTEVSTGRGHLLGLFVTEPVQERDFAAAAAAIRAQGGLAVLAHPFQKPGADPEDLFPHVDGMETQNSRANRKNRNANRLAAAFAYRYGLLPFGGSDAHVPQEIGASVTVIDTEELTLEAVRTALTSGAAHVEGADSPARYTAASQWTKLRKTHAGIGAYGKWFLFAVRCLLQDLF